MIYDTALVTGSISAHFQDNLDRALSQYAERGLRTEIQFSTAYNGSYVVWSALVVVHKDDHV